MELVNWRGRYPGDRQRWRDKKSSCLEKWSTEDYGNCYHGNNDGLPFVNLIDVSG